MKDGRPEREDSLGEEHWMRMALRLARKGEGLTSPNPMVGAVVISPSGELAGTGWHRGPGKLHAEALALQEAGDGAKRGVVFVNLEPCAHQGRTPACTDALLAAGVSRVVLSMEDPDPRVSGRGLAVLRTAGVDVDVGLLEQQARDLNRAYIMHRSQHRPFVTLKVAASLDGRTSAADRSSRWITGERARRDVHRIRARSDAVCVGIGTVLSDDPELSVRGVEAGRATCRVVVDSMARTPIEARVLSSDAPTVIFVSRAAPDDRIQALQRAGAEVVILPSDFSPVPLDGLLSHLGKAAVLELLLEGGPRLAGAFAGLGYIDRYLIYLAPKLLGGPVTGSIIDGWAAKSIEHAKPLRISSVKRLGDDLRIEAFPEIGPSAPL